MSEFKEIYHAINEAQDGKGLTPKQEQILKAAVEIFAEKGYASSSTSEIAARAGVAEGTIFRHYKTKKDLLFSIVTPFMTQFTVPFLASHFTKEVFDEPPEDFEPFLKKIIKNRFEFAKENSPLLKIVLQEIAFQPELQSRYESVFLEEVFPKFEHSLNQLKERGSVIDFPNRSIIRMIISTVVGFLVTRFLLAPESDWEDEEELDRTIHFIMYGLAGK
ncbi:TetR/AcrR family transcriptional regulator [Halobacillus sp. K22]|uniref:TetR/AcrR family transcriptional regulator n=1 Tax=Halobacillus sp. K22 TaxID=3457431 RepID=UPI003FCE594B